MAVDQSICSVRGCPNKPLRIKSRLCGTHYGRLRTHGNLEGIPAKKLCRVCEDEFQPERSTRIYCSLKCAREAEKRECANDGCDRPVRFNGKCHKHAKREWRERILGHKSCENCGNTFGYRNPKTRSCSAKCANVLARASGEWATNAKPLTLALDAGDRSKIIDCIQGECELVAQGGCWLWPRRNVHGYGVANIRGKHHMVHRLAYEVFTGEKLGSEDAHHVCGVAACVNPDHIVPASRIENILESRQRNGLIARIAELEAALAKLDPSSELLGPQT